MKKVELIELMGCEINDIVRKYRNKKMSSFFMAAVLRNAADAIVFLKHANIMAEQIQKQKDKK